jgi:FtsH-binding integral membrane protein
MNANSLYSDRSIVAYAGPDVRAGFIRRTYGHLAGAILAFIAIEFLLFQTGLPETMMGLLATSQYSWLIVLAAFMGISYMADRWAQSDASPQTQYAGLSLYVVAEAIIFVPLLYMAAAISGSEVIVSAGLITLLLFTGLTFTVLTTKKDFSFLGGFLKISFFVALGIIVASVLFGFNLGVLFASLMVIVAAASILYNTSNVLHRYNPSQHVAASLTLFASIALLFWYILRILMGGSARRD